MQTGLEKLSDKEKELIQKAPLLVCILIAGADNEIDRKEIKHAVQLSRKKKNKYSPALASFYEDLSGDFEDKLKIVLQGLPVHTLDRNSLIVQDLTNLNGIFRKLEYSFAQEFIQSLKYVARSIAESSGGMLGLKSIGEDESRLIELPMLKELPGP